MLQQQRWRSASNFDIIARYMLQFKWTRLRLHLLPLLARETQAVLAYHAALRAEIDQGKMEALERLAELKVQVGRRARELQLFMKENEEEECIAYLRSEVELMLGKVCGEKREGEVREEEKSVPWKAQNRKKELAISSKSSRKSVSPLKDSKMSRSSKALQDSRAESNKLSSSKSSKSKLTTNAQSINQKSRNKKAPSPPAADSQSNRQQALPHFAAAEHPPSPLEISFNNKHLFAAEQTTVTFKLSRKDYQEIMRLKVKQKPMKI